MKLFENVTCPFVVYDDGKLAAIFKPSNIHTERIARSDSPSLSDWVSRTFEHRDAKLVNRLDFATSGIVLTAFGNDAYAYYTSLQDSLKISKEYRAVCFRSSGPLEGSVPLFPEEKIPDAKDASLVIASRFRAYGENASRVACASPHVKTRRKKGWTDSIYETSVKRVDFTDFSDLMSNKAGFGNGSTADLQDGIAFFSAEIRKGFRHQIRAHLAWEGWPIAGDAVYSGDSGRFGRMYLEAVSVTIEMPDSEPLCISTEKISSI